MKKQNICIKEAAEIFGVCTQTLRVWEKQGKLTPILTDGGHRRYDRTYIEKLAGVYVDPLPLVQTNRVAIYSRVSTFEQKKSGDLERQVGRLTTEAIRRGYNIVSVLEEVGSGMNDKRNKLQKLFELIEKKEIDIVLIEHKDRLSRFCINYLLEYFKSYNVRVEWVEEIIGKSYEDELVGDILSLMTSFSAKIHGKRSHKNKKKELLYG